MSSRLCSPGTLLVLGPRKSMQWMSMSTDSGEGRTTWQISFFGRVTRRVRSVILEAHLTRYPQPPAMSSVPPSGPPPTPPSGNNPEKQPEAQPSSTPPPAVQNGAAMDTTPDQPQEETWDDIPTDIISLGTDEILTRIRLIENDIKVRVLK